MVQDNSIDEAVEEVTRVILHAANVTIPRTKSKFKNQTKPWWNNECHLANKKQKKAWNIFRRYPSTQNLICFKKARAEFRRIKRRSQRVSWVNYISTITSSISSRELWQKVKKASGVHSSNAISILNVNGQLVSSLKDIANSIASTLADTSSSQNYNSLFLSHKQKTERKKLNFKTRTSFPYNQNFTYQEFLLCLSSTHKSAPGPDLISYIMIQHLNSESQKNLLYLYNRIWNEYHFPTSWQHALVIPLLKPGKNSADPSNYRPIALTSCLCKLLERMVNRRLIYFLERNNLLNQNQSGFRRGRSTLDNLLALETDIRLAFLQRKHLVAIFVHIEKAYDRTWRYGILKDLYDFNLRGNLPIFIQKFLAFRKFQVRVGSELSDFYVQEEGVPQGSVLSVTLFNLKINNILNQIPQSVKAYLYVDDLYISCTGNHMNFIERQLQNAVNSIQKWSIMNGFTLSTSKTAAVHFCRKRNLHLDPEIKLDGHSIPLLNEIRFLGVIFDKKLTFLPHVISLRKKCERSLNILRVLSTTAWGADQLSMMRIYRAIILSKIDYGCVIYGSSRKTVLQKLDPVHHTALRICSGAFRTSPVKSLYVDSYEPSLSLRRQMLSLHFYFKIESRPHHPFHNYRLRPFLIRLQEKRKSTTPIFFTRMRTTLSDLNLSYLNVSPHAMNNFPPWKNNDFNYLNPFKNFPKNQTTDTIYQKLYFEHRSHYRTFTPIFTDGSKTSTDTSLAVVFPDKILSFKLRQFCSIFTAEITAVQLALTNILNRPCGCYIIYIDSLSVLQSLKSSNHQSHPLVFSVLELYSKLLFRGFTVLFCWIPSHVGIRGNENADKAAKSASAFYNTPVPACDLKKHIKYQLYFSWQTQWNIETQNKLHAVKPVIENWPSMRNRKSDTVLTRLRIGHTRLTHRYLLMGEQAPTCTHCGCSLSVIHFLVECPFFNSQRLRYFQTTSITLLTLIGTYPHEKLFPFLKSIGFYSLI
ncbi:RNA-directed DNA polymerase from mobile element jockey [Araneus ventricosus]|uniref:RNA-directed DNA polymerase from mobile element jockey n=1 Tax=Araneus ventricosus TaxID=182803 RepID=A0A4Y2MKZ2_ARAVE|nr:RNA-directed DNA polymerase from mobile element jockey [Araneus ventricosus]